MNNPDTSILAPNRPALRVKQLAASIHLSGLQFDSGTVSPSWSRTHIMAYDFNVLPRLSV